MHQWPVGQVVKTEASHAFNIGSNPVRVTKISLTSAKKGAIIQKPLEAKAFDIEVVQSHRTELVLIAVRVHLFPSRTQKLSSFASTILAGRLAGKIDNANTKIPP